MPSIVYLLSSGDVPSALHDITVMSTGDYAVTVTGTPTCSSATLLPSTGSRCDPSGQPVTVQFEEGPGRRPQSVRVLYRDGYQLAVDVASYN